LGCCGLLNPPNLQGKETNIKIGEKICQQKKLKLWTERHKQILHVAVSGVKYLKKKYEIVKIRTAP
jgi:hypothetical protein